MKSIFSRMKIFQKIATGIFIIFMSLMGLVCFAAYSRISGSTRQDMAQAQFARVEASRKKAAQVEEDRKALITEQPSPAPNSL